MLTGFLRKQISKFSSLHTEKVEEKVEMGRERKGTILETKGKIYARVRFKDENGKQRDIWRVAESKAEARAKLKELLKQTETLSAKQLDAVNITVRELADYYCKNYLHKAVYVGEKKVSGVRGLKESLYALKPVVDYFGSQKIKDITYGDINRFKQIRLTTPTKYGKQRSIPSVNKELGKLKRILNVAVQEQWVSRNPFNNGKSLIEQEEHRNRVLSFDEETRLLTAIESKLNRKHLKGMVLLGLDCALRRGEIFQLRFSDLDFDKRIITIRAFITKTARKRTVAMTKRVFEELSELWIKSAKNPDELIFGVTVTIKTAWKKICREAGIDDFRFHDTRHTSITRLIRSGLPPVECMKVSGHTTLSAFNIYSNLEADSIFRAANALDNYLAFQNEVQTKQREESNLIN